MALSWRCVLRARTLRRQLPKLRGSAARREPRHLDRWHERVPRLRLESNRRNTQVQILPGPFAPEVIAEEHLEPCEPSTKFLGYGTTRSSLKPNRKRGFESCSGLCQSYE